MKFSCAGVTLITRVIVTSCYIANNNSTFFKLYRQVKSLNWRLRILSDVARRGLRPPEWAMKKGIEEGGESGDVDDIDG
ncbi:hypothetical protein BZP36_06395 [Raoultella terrigena]|nr:hypothetical protein BZP36_06395 [Raoultella terrigena]